MMRTRDRHTGAGKTWLARAIVLAVGAATLTVPLGIMTGAEAARLQPRTTSPTSTLAVIKTIGVGSYPEGVAVNNEDDTVYVTNFNSDNVSVINGRAGQRTDDTISVGDGPWGVAVDQSDDTVYVTNDLAGDVSVINGRSGQNTNADITVGTRPHGIAVDQGDDTVYVANLGSDYLSVINGRTRTPSTVPLGTAFGSWDVAVDQGDDTVYVTDYDSNRISVIRGRSTDDSSTIGVGTTPYGVAVDQNDDTVYVVNHASSSVSVIDGRSRAVTRTVSVDSYSYGVAVDQNNDTVYVTRDTFPGFVTAFDGRNVDDSSTLTLWGGARGVAVDDSGTNAGLVYVANQSTNNVSVIGRVTPTLAPASGAAGDAATITVTVPNLAPGFAMDDSTITSISFGGTPATGLAAGAGDTWTVTVPAGSGTVAVTVNFKGGRSASAGDFTYGTSPGPTPPAPTPATAPLDVTATAGDAAASVTWKAPASPGDYPITTYKATSTPGGRTCLVTVPALTCEITGLTNGTAYTFTVQALTGAGWGATSTPSNAVTPTAPPRPTITTTGTRDGDRIMVTGTSNELTGKTLRPWIRFPGQTSYTEGIAVINPSADGSFTWQRKTGKKAYVYIAHEETRSNTVIIPAR
jgi:YVTN family beta-propeller protein